MKADRVAVVCLWVLVTASAATAQTVGFVERFALAADREAVLKELVPGTADYFYFHCLHYQNTARLDEAAKLLESWPKDLDPPRQTEIRSRQMLLNYSSAPDATIDHLTRTLGLTFTHEREHQPEESTLPSMLDPQLISAATLTERALNQANPGNEFAGFEPSAYDWLIARALDPAQRRDLLQRLDRPDFYNLPKLIADELNTRDGMSFGQLPVHRMLTLGQMDELVSLKPDLLNSGEFIGLYVQKLAPTNEVVLEQDAEEKAAYLARLEAFASRLPAAQNSLRGHVMYHRLQQNRKLGIYDRELFLAYLRLPRVVPYARPDFLAKTKNSEALVDLGFDLNGATRLAAIGDDEPLVRSYLEHFLAEKDSYAAFEPYVESDYLRRIYATTQLLRGGGNPEEWSKWLSPDEFAALRDRVDIEFDPANKPYFAADEPVSLDVWVKNVPTLIVRVYEINAENYYRQQRREVNTDIDLDGLAPNSEQVVNYDDPPIRREKRHFDLPTLEKRGVYIIDLIGNGMSSRALIRKGRLQHAVRTGSAGQVFTIYNESGEPVKGARVWVSGHEYAAAEDGSVTVPFTANPADEAAVISDGDFSTLVNFNHVAENYSLVSGMHIDRESLVRGETARVVVRPQLLMNGIPVSLSLLEEPTLVVTTADRENVPARKEVPGFVLQEDRDSVHEFRVPEDLQSVTVALKGRVKQLATGEHLEVVTQESFALNRIDLAANTEALHLGRGAGGYTLDLLGKTGEARPNRPVQLWLKHRDFKEPVQQALQTDDAGRIQLGSLDGITELRATGPEGAQQAWNLTEDRHTYPTLINAVEGETIRLPYMGKATAPVPAELSLHETRGGMVVNNRFDALSIEDGYLVIGGLTASDYWLSIRPAGTAITLRVTKGVERDGYILTGRGFLEASNTAPLQIADATVNGDNIEIRVGNPTADTRVHVVATVFSPTRTAFADLSRTVRPEPKATYWPLMENGYLSSRSIGDEYRYVLERKYAKKFAGVMLERPGLLLTPWSVASTEAGQPDLAPQEMAAMMAGEAAAPAPSPAPPQEGQSTVGGEYANLDFLPGSGVTFYNLVPDKDGVIRIPQGDLAGRRELHVVAVNGRETAYRQLALTDKNPAFRDLRLAHVIPADTHVIEQKLVTPLLAGGEWSTADRGARFEIYDTVGRVFGFYATLLQGNPENLNDFAFLARWSKLTDAEKRENYSKYACHELNFFLSRKDAPFFEAVVKPFVANKLDKQFMDHWLLGDDLTGYVSPRAYERLNILERILLGQRVAEERGRTLAHVRDLAALAVPNPDQLTFLFNAALQGGALDGLQNLGLASPGPEGAFTWSGILTDNADDEGRSANRAGDQAAGGFGGGGAGVGGGTDNAEYNYADTAVGDEDASERGRVSNTQPRLKGRLEEMKLLPEPSDRVQKLNESLDPASAPAEAAKSSTGGSYQYDINGDGVAESIPVYSREAKDDLARRESVRQLYRAVDQTREWVESNYYRVPSAQQGPGLVAPTAFWKEYAEFSLQDAAPSAPFLPPTFLEAARNRTEALLALAVIDLPFEAGAHEGRRDGDALTLKAASPILLVHKAVAPAAPAGDGATVLVSERFFDVADPFRYEGGERIDKFVEGEFLIQTVYGCRVVVTNPTSSPQRLDVLLQIPQGAVPVNATAYTRTRTIRLEPYNTHAIEYYFYFPAEGTFEHYPVQVVGDGSLLASAAPASLKAVPALSAPDTTSWRYVAQRADNARVLEYLATENLARVNVADLAWRMKDRAFYDAVLARLRERHVFDATLWSYAVYHKDPAGLREFLGRSALLVAQVGPYLESELLTIDPVEEKTYEHLEYAPLVNARAHRVGAERKILNEGLARQYGNLMNVLSHRTRFDSDDQLEVAYYLLLQDRVEEALDFFGRVDRNALAAQLQYDYLAAYLALAREDAAAAKSAAGKYADYPVDRWRELFGEVLSQVAEIEGAAARPANPDEPKQDQLASQEPGLELKVEAPEEASAPRISLAYRNVSEVRVNYYPMDVELLFSRDPFGQRNSQQFASIRPNHTETVALPADKREHAFDLPEQFRRSNVVVEVEAGGVRRTQAYYANSLTVHLIEPYGQVQVLQQASGAPLPKVYVKAFARMKDGSVKFYKDGYTDLRGRFDYATVSTNDLPNVERFALLVVSESDGAVVREAAPPQP